MSIYIKSVAAPGACGRGAKHTVSVQKNIYTLYLRINMYINICVNIHRV